MSHGTHTPPDQFRPKEKPALGAISRAAGHQGTGRGANGPCAGVQTGLKRVVEGAIGRDKLAVIHLARRDLGMDDDVYRKTLRDLAGVDSSAELDEKGFKAVMARFNQLGFQPGWPSGRPARQPAGDRIGMATAAQLDYIRSLWKQWLGREDDAALTKWIEGRYHVSALRFLTVQAAQKAVNGLRVMVRQKAAGQSNRPHFDQTETGA